jgi:hypothetical protein
MSKVEIGDFEICIGESNGEFTAMLFLYVTKFGDLYPQLRQSIRKDQNHGFATAREALDISLKSWGHLNPHVPNLEQPTKDVATHQPQPTGEGAVVLDYVIEHLDKWLVVDAARLAPDLKARAEEGLKKYGTYLRTNNGRDALIDAYQEILDAVMYLGQWMLETSQARAFYGTAAQSRFIDILQIAVLLKHKIDERGA